MLFTELCVRVHLHSIYPANVVVLTVSAGAALRGVNINFQFGQEPRGEFGIDSSVC